MNDQNNLLISSPYRALNDQDSLQVSTGTGKVKILSPTDGQTNFAQGGLYQWAYSLDNQWFRVEVATDNVFTNIVQKAEVQAEQLTSTIPIGTGYYIRVSAVEYVNPDFGEVTGVSLIIPSTTVKAGETLIIDGSVQGNGNYDTTGTWERLAGGDAIPFTVSGNSITITGDTENNTGDFKFSANGDPTFSQTVSISVTAASSGVTQVDSSQGDFDSLMIIYNNTLPTYPTLASTNDLPDPNTVDAGTAYYINDEIHRATRVVSGEDAQGNETFTNQWYNEFRPWSNRTGWDTMTVETMGDAFGVTVNTDNRVTALELRSNRLVGTLEEFPGLQQCTRFRLRQREDNYSGTPYSGNFQPVRLYGTLPKSFAHTSATFLELATRSNDVEQQQIKSYDLKNGIPANQFIGGIPDEWYALKLEVLMIDGQDPEFQVELKEACSNWDTMKWFFMTANGFYHENNSLKRGNLDQFWSATNIVGGLPSGMSTWVNCERLHLSGQFFDSIPVDVFDNWNNIPREILIDATSSFSSNLPRINQQVPLIPHLNQIEKFRFQGHGWNGDPGFYLLTFPDIRQWGVGFTEVNSNTDFPPISEHTNVLERFSFRNNSTIPSNYTGTLYPVGVNVNGLYGNKIINYYVGKDRPEMVTSYPYGAHNWYRCRYFEFYDCQASDPRLPEKPPAMYSTQLREVRMQGTGLIGQLTEHWANIGGTVKYGPTYYTGTITDFGEDATGFWIEDSNANFTPDEFAKSEWDKANVVEHPNSNSNASRGILSNTSTRIYYNGDVNLAEGPIAFKQMSIGNSFLVKDHNDGQDPRSLNKGINLSGNNMYGPFISAAIPVAMEGGTYNVRGNKYVIKDFYPYLSDWENAATANGWSLSYGSQQRFGEGRPDIADIPDVTVNVGQQIVIDASAYDVTGNSYTWFKDNVEIANTGSSLTIASATSGDAGFYRIEITNPAVPDLTDESKNIQVTVN